jgi:hypothetical protein
MAAGGRDKGVTTREMRGATPFSFPTHADREQ